MKSADICFLVFLFIKRRSGTGQCIRAFPDLTFDDDQNAESINFLVLLDYLWWCITLFLVMFLSTEKPSRHSSSPNLKWFYFPYQKKKKMILRLPWCLSGGESSCRCRRHPLHSRSEQILHAAETPGLRATMTEAALKPGAATTEHAAAATGTHAMRSSNCRAALARCN